MVVKIMSLTVAVGEVRHKAITPESVLSRPLLGRIHQGSDSDLDLGVLVTD